MMVLYSNTSSKGNCSVIESSDGHLIIIDAGIKYKTVDREIGYRLHKADALLITHAHKDHTSFLTSFQNCCIPVLLGEKTKSELTVGPYIGEVFPTDKFGIFETPGFLVRLLEMKHTNSDGTPCECFGFLILDKSTDERMLWATDTQYIKNKFPPLDFYCIESNFFECSDYNEDIDCTEKKVEKRRMQSHMSFETAVKFLKMQDLSKCKEIRLLHLSSSLSEEDKKKMKRKLRSELKAQISGKGVKIYA